MRPLFILITILLSCSALMGQNFDKAVEHYDNYEDSLAIEEFLKCEPYYKAKYGELDTAYYSKTLYCLGGLYRDCGEYDLSLKYLNEVKAIYVSLGCTNSTLYALYLDAMGIYFYYINKHNKAIVCYDSALYIRENLNQENTIEYAKVLGNIGAAYDGLSQYEKALSFYNRELNILDSLNMKNTFVYSKALGNIGVAYEGLSQYEKALSYYNRELNILDSLNMQNTFEYSETLGNIGVAYDNLSQYDKALEFCKRMLNVLDSLDMQNTFEYSQTLLNIGVAYVDLNQNEKSFDYFNRSKELLESLDLQETVDYSDVLHNIGFAYDGLGNFSQALNYYNLEIRLLSHIGMQEKSIYASILADIGAVYIDMGQYDSALDCSFKVKNVLDEFNNINTIEYSRVLDNLGSVNENLGQYEKALNFYNQELNILDSLSMQNTFGYAETLNQVGNTYSVLSEFEKALEYYNKDLDIYGNHGVEGFIGYSMVLNNIGFTYREIGQQNKAMKFYHESRLILENLQLVNHSDYLNIINNIADVYYDTGNYNKALDYCGKTNVIVDSINFIDTYYNADLYRSFGRIYLALKQYTKALDYFNSELKLRGKLELSNTLDYGIALQNQASAYKGLKNYKKTEQLCKRASSLMLSLELEDGLYYAESLTALSECLQEMGQLDTALIKYDEALKAYRNADLTKSDSYFYATQSLGSLYQERGEDEKAEACYLKVNNYRNEHAVENIYLSDFSNTNYIKESYGNQSILDFAIEDYHSPALLNSCFKTNSLLKGIYSSRQVKNADAEEEINLLVEDYRKKRKQLTNYYCNVYTWDKSVVDSLENSISKIKEKLDQDAFAASQELMHSSFEDIQQALKPGEAAIDFVHYSTYDAKVDKTDTVQYAAFVVRAQDECPSLVKLFTAQEMIDFTKVIKGEVKAHSPLDELLTYEYIPKLYEYNNGDNLYQKIWSPIDSLLQGIEKVYMSPTGLLHEIAFAALPQGKNTRLSDKYTVEYLTTLSQLPVSTVPLYCAGTTSAAIFGNMNYDTYSSYTKISPSKLALTRGVSDVSFQNKNKWQSLGNANEINQISQLFSTSTTHTYEKDNAVEESFLALDGQSPEVIHLSTHAQYNGLKKETSDFTDSTWYVSSPDPLLRSYLVMSGANTLGEERQTTLNDGKLTAYEVSTMDLSNTKLATLAACQTGLGDINDYEGAIGLKQAFKMAGVDYLLLSLWNVADKQTSELVELFYEKWVNDKLEVKAAFREAQKAMQQKYPDNPYYWAGFVLVQ